MSTPGLDRSAVEALDIAWVRAQFPSLQTQVNGQLAAFLDGPAGTQVPTQVMHAIQGYLMSANANTGGAFLTSRRNDEMIASTRAAMADFFHCDRDEVVFSQNMTTITFALSRAIASELNAGDEILLTTLDHDANFSPWRALEEKGVLIRRSISANRLHPEPGRFEEQAERENPAGCGGICIQHRGHHQSCRGNYATGPRGWSVDVHRRGPLRTSRAD